MTLALTSPGRRRVLVGAAAFAVAPALLAQPAKAAARSVLVAQIVDTSPTQQDVSKDFLIGSRAAWQDINLKGGFPVIQGGPSWKRGNIVQAIKDDRDSRDERVTSRSKRK